MSSSILEIIRKKRDGASLTRDEINLFVEVVVTRAIEDCQIAYSWYSKDITDVNILLKQTMKSWKFLESLTDKSKAQGLHSLRQINQEKLGQLNYDITSLTMTEGHKFESKVGGAMLMAIFLKDLIVDETVHLTEALVATGSVLRFPCSYKNLLVDKHSTGGVGDKVSLVLAPALAACGLKVPMISGRSLGFTGGTLDKLESIPGFQVHLNFDQMKTCLETAECFIASATESLAPGDKILYSIRDITGTVENMSLITSSILSKKKAEGIGALVVDVKFGKGASFVTIEEAKRLGSLLVQVGKRMDLPTKVVFSPMNNPLGSCVGNSLEVVEALRCLRNEINNEVTELVKILGGTILEAKGKAPNLNEGKILIEESIKSGKALERFEMMLTQQGVKKATAKKLCSGDFENVLPKAIYSTLFRSLKKGYVEEINALNIGKACWYLGGGRTKADAKIDHSAGVILLKRTGEYVNFDEPWIEVHHSKKIQPEVESLIQKSLTVVA